MFLPSQIYHIKRNIKVAEFLTSKLGVLNIGIRQRKRNTHEVMMASDIKHI